MSDKFTPDDVRLWLVAAAAHDNGAGLGAWVMHGNTTAEQARAIIGARLRRRRPGVDVTPCSHDRTPSTAHGGRVGTPVGRAQAAGHYATLTDLIKLIGPPGSPPPGQQR